jgi:hypothetical protein
VFIGKLRQSANQANQQEQEHTLFPGARGRMLFQTSRNIRAAPACLRGR